MACAYCGLTFNATLVDRGHPKWEYLNDILVAVGINASIHLCNTCCGILIQVAKTIHKLRELTKDESNFFCDLCHTPERILAPARKIERVVVMMISDFNDDVKICGVCGKDLLLVLRFVAEIAAAQN